MNGEHIRRLPVEQLAAETLPFAKARYGDRSTSEFEAAVPLAQERATTLVQIADQAEFLFVPDDELEIDADAVDAVRKLDRVDDLLAAAIAHVENCEWTHDGIDLRPVVDELGLKRKIVMQALYAAIKGRTAGLPLFESIELLGRESALERLRRAARGSPRDEARVQDRVADRARRSSRSSSSTSR